MSRERRGRGQIGARGEAKGWREERYGRRDRMWEKREIQEEESLKRGEAERGEQG